MDLDPERARLELARIERRLGQLRQQRTATRDVAAEAVGILRRPNVTTQEKRAMNPTTERKPAPNIVRPEPQTFVGADGQARRISPSGAPSGGGATSGGSASAPTAAADVASKMYRPEPTQNARPVATAPRLDAVGPPTESRQTTGLLNSGANFFAGQNTGVRLVRPDGSVSPPRDGAPTGTFNSVPSTAFTKPGLGVMGIAGGDRPGASTQVTRYQQEVANAQARNTATANRAPSQTPPGFTDAQWREEQTRRMSQSLTRPQTQTQREATAAMSRDVVGANLDQTASAQQAAAAERAGGLDIQRTVVANEGKANAAEVGRLRAQEQAAAQQELADSNNAAMLQRGRERGRRSVQQAFENTPAKAAPPTAAAPVGAMQSLAGTRPSSLDAFLGAARAANPGYSDEELTAFYGQTYGGQ